MSLRQERLKKEFFKFLKEFFTYDVKNPLLKDISVQEVNISGDLSYLKVFYYVENEPDKKFKRALEKLIPVIKSQIPLHMSIRKIPEIKFIYDNRTEYVQKVDEILNKITYSEQSLEELNQNYKKLDFDDIED